MRYFVDTLSKVYDLEQQISKEQTDKVFQAIFYKSDNIKRFTWFLMSKDIAFERKNVGSGIVIFYVDMTMSYFVAGKE